MKLPEPTHAHTTATAIVRWYEKQDQSRRPHLGCSEIGKPCDRQLWYSFRWCIERKFEGRLLRLFDTGFREEHRFLEELRAIGAEVYDIDPDTGKQHNFSAVNGHFGGSCDAIGRGLPEGPKTWAIIEFKTHNDKSFKELLSKSVKVHKPEHYAQMICYMGFADLDRALYLAVNKNTDEVYSDWVHFDKVEFKKLLARAEKIISADSPPEGISQDPSWYQCKFCDFNDLCHGQRAAVKNCRTCVHATPVENAAWTCESQNRLLSFEEQKLGCRSHLLIPSLVPYATAIDAGEGFIKYQSNTVTFANVTEDCDRGEENMTNDITACFTSAELSITPPAIVLDNNLHHLKTTFDAKIIEGAPF